MKIREVIKITGVPVVLASLCCLSPLILVVFGISSISFATSLADTFYGDWKWAFRAVGLAFLILFLFLHFRKKGICSLDAAKRNRNKIINTVLVSLIIAVLGYIFWLYVVVHYAGVWLKVWE